MKTEIMTLAFEHPYMTFGIGLVGSYGIYKLADKLIDRVSTTANHAIEARYSFETPSGDFKVYPPQLPPPQ